MFFKKIISKIYFNFFKINDFCIEREQKIYGWHKQNVHALKNYKRYKDDIYKFKKEIDSNDSTVPHKHPKKIWVCWLQGFDNAPEIVKSCRRSLINI